MANIFMYKRKLDQTWAGVLVSKTTTVHQDSAKITHQCRICRILCNFITSFLQNVQFNFHHPGSLSISLTFAAVFIMNCVNSNYSTTFTRMCPRKKRPCNLGNLFGKIKESCSIIFPESVILTLKEKTAAEHFRPSVNLPV